MAYPTEIQEYVNDLAMLSDRTERIQALIDLSKSFRPSEKSKPYDKEFRVPGCESEVYIWVEPGIHLDIAVDNPQGISAMALAALLQMGLEGKPASEAAKLDEDLVLQLFGRELSMGKSLGLTNMVRQIKRLAQGLT